MNTLEVSKVFSEEAVSLSVIVVVEVVVGSVDCFLGDALVVFEEPADFWELDQELVLGDVDELGFVTCDGAGFVGAGSVGVGSVGVGSVGVGSIGIGSVGVGSVGAGSVGVGSVGVGSVGVGSAGAGSVGAGSVDAAINFNCPEKHLISI